MAVSWLVCVPALTDLNSPRGRFLVAPAPYDPRRFFLNDGKCDREGRFWVGPMRHSLPPLVGPPGEKQGPLWRLEKDRLVAAGDKSALSNGLAWSPDGRTMYHSHTETGEINAWDYDPATGEMARAGCSLGWTVHLVRMGPRSIATAIIGLRSTARDAFSASIRMARVSANCVRHPSSRPWFVRRSRTANPVWSPRGAGRSPARMLPIIRLTAASPPSRRPCPDCLARGGGAERRPISR